MFIKNKLILLLVIALPYIANGQNLFIFSFDVSHGDVLTSTGGSIGDGSLLRYGTFSSEPIGPSFTSIADFENAFTEVGTIVSDSAGKYGAGPISVVAGDYYAWAYNQSTATISASTEIAIFGIGSVPAFGPPAIITPVASTAYFGSKVGSDIRTQLAAVPEPSTYAAIAGALALGFVAYRRRKNK